MIIRDRVKNGKCEFYKYFTTEKDAKDFEAVAVFNGDVILYSNQSSVLRSCYFVLRAILVVITLGFIRDDTRYYDYLERSLLDYSEWWLTKKYEYWAYWWHYRNEPFDYFLLDDEFVVGVTHSLSKAFKLLVSYARDYHRLPRIERNYQIDYMEDN